MKKIKTVLTAIVMLFASSTFALGGPETATPKVKAAFANDFSKASLVSWEKSNDFYFASFTLNNTKVDAAYNEAGELLGTSRKISAEQMPLSISMAITDRYEGCELEKNAIELTYEGLTRYYITIKSKNQLIKLKCFSDGNIEVESKTKV
ncbi:MAG TPA: hypothetical protein PK987_13015 [Ferruginibacter sp.]|nr:hypothetical protein [Ferruginibacter sp.]